MAGYEIVAVIPGQRLEGGIRIVETIEAVAFSKPHDISFSVVVDKVEGWKADLAGKVAAEANELESVFDI